MCIFSCATEAQRTQRKPFWKVSVFSGLLWHNYHVILLRYLLSNYEVLFWSVNSLCLCAFVVEKKLFELTTKTQRHKEFIHNYLWFVGGSFCRHFLLFQSLNKNRSLNNASDAHIERFNAVVVQLVDIIGRPCLNPIVSAHFPNAARRLMWCWILGSAPHQSARFQSFLALFSRRRLFKGWTVARSTG